MRTPLEGPAVCALSLALSGCFAVTDLGRFKQAEPNNSNFHDLEFTIRGADSHVEQTFELRLVDDTDTILMRMIAAPLGGPSATFTLPSAVPKKQANLRLFFFSDYNKSGRFDQSPPPGDHGWKLSVDDFKPREASDNLVRVVFDHSTKFDLVVGKEFGNPASIKLGNMGGYLGKRLNVRIADASSKQLVGQYRVTKIGQPAFDVAIPGVIDTAPGTRYAVQITADDGTPAAGALEGFRLEKASDNDGLKIDFDPVRDAGLKDPGPVPLP